MLGMDEVEAGLGDGTLVDALEGGGVEAELGGVFGDAGWEGFERNTVGLEVHHPEGVGQNQGEVHGALDDDEIVGGQLGGWGGGGEFR